MCLLSINCPRQDSLPQMTSARAVLDVWNRGVKHALNTYTSAIGFVNTDRLKLQHFSHADGGPQSSMIEPPPFDRAIHPIKP